MVRKFASRARGFKRSKLVKRKKQTRDHPKAREGRSRKKSHVTNEAWLISVDVILRTETEKVTGPDGSVIVILPARLGWFIS